MMTNYNASMTQGLLFKSMDAGTNVPRESPDLVSSSDEYARRFDGAVGEYFLEVQRNIVRGMLPPAHHCRVLDIGGGHAQLASTLSADGYEVTVFASDASCRERLNRIVGPEKFSLVTGNLLDLPLKPDSFDVVLAFRLLSHLSDWRRFMSEICRVAKQSIIFDYADLRSVNWLANRTFAFKQRIENNARRYRCFHRKEVMTELHANCFVERTLRGQFVLPMALHRMMKSAALSKLLEGCAESVGLTRLFGSPIILNAEPVGPS